MLRQTKTLDKARILAADGVVGTLHDLYFDEYTKQIQYLQVRLQRPFRNGYVFIPKDALGQLDSHGRTISVHLTKTEIRNSPGLPLQPGRLRSMKETTTYKVAGPHETFGRVVQWLLDDTSWTFPFFIIRGEAESERRTMLSSDSVTSVSHEERKLLTRLSKEAVAESPHLESVAPDEHTNTPGETN